MKKLLFISHINWGWIYQRPQIIAEGLAQHFSVTVAYPKSIIRKELGFEKKSNIDYRIIKTFPKYDMSAMSYMIFEILNLVIFRDISDFDYIYICHPSFFSLIHNNYKGKVIYDCMDDYEVLSGSRYLRNACQRIERKIARSNAIVLVTSQKLKDKIDSYAGENKAVLIRNGTFFEEDEYQVDVAKVKDKYEVAYFGTISEWFDYKLLVAAKENLACVRYKLIGPSMNQNNEEIFEYIDSVPHEKLYQEIKDASCLIMPFITNDIVLSVDPVKLYEYMRFGKCIVSVWYPEIDRFRDYIYFYKNLKDYIVLMKELGEKGFPPKYTKSMRDRFLKDNCWDARINKIINMLGES